MLYQYIETDISSTILYDRSFNWFMLCLWLERGRIEFIGSGTETVDRYLKAVTV